MRVIAGTAKGRKLVAPPGLDTRPMTSRAREALFSSIASLLSGAKVLDLYAGSGSLGIEALSRGAAAVTFVENARPALKALRRNLDTTGFDGDVLPTDVAKAIPKLGGVFDVVFVDPPFEMEASEVERLMADLVTATAPGATVVVHRRAGDPVPEPSQFEAVSDHRYGDTVLIRYRSGS